MKVAGLGVTGLDGVIGFKRGGRPTVGPWDIISCLTFRAKLTP